MAKKAVLKYNAVFITDDDVDTLLQLGFGAKEYLSDSTESHLHLSDEEAFYLAANSHLQLIDIVKNEQVSLMNLWTVFLQNSATFPVKYKAYCFFRDQRYVVKSGLHYGVDLTVYRQRPTHCHSEMCVTVVNATCEELSLNTEAIDSDCEDHVAGGAVNWRHVSTLTRVIPDVMKMAVVCYVETIRIHSATSTTLSSEVSPYEHLFPQNSISGVPQIDFSSPACLDLLQVRPVTVLVRRLPAKAETYCTVGSIHAKYRAKSVLKKPRVTGGMASKAKKRRKRRDPAELRAKGQSKANKLWSTLLQSPNGIVTTGIKSNTTVLSNALS